MKMMVNTRSKGKLWIETNHITNISTDGSDRAKIRLACGTDFVVLMGFKEFIDTVIQLETQGLLKGK